jgi:hypothetical protein
MPKKTSRSARALQAQRASLTGDRKNTARPLLDVGNSRLVAERPTRATLDQIDKEFETEPEAVPARKETSTATRPVNETRSSLPANGSQIIRPANPSPARRSIARRTSTAVTRAPAISREEEYAYIRSDLMTVLALTVLMVIILVVLTFVIGR